MSHYSEYRTEFVSQECLIKALNDMGYLTVEVHENPAHLMGYEGDQRGQTAHVIVRRRYISSVANDLGFVKNESGAFAAIISEYDRDRHDAEWMNKLADRYAYHAAYEWAAEQGYDIVEDTEQNGEITLRAVQW